MKNLVLLFSAVVCVFLASCEPKETPSPRANAESKPEPAPESRKLPPLPKTVTAEFIMDLWARPHDGTGVMEELEDYALKPGVWKWVRNIGPRKGELKKSIEVSVANKVVDRRFIVRQFTSDGKVVYGVVTYDHAVEGYRWWELMPDGFINEFFGKPYRRNLLEWSSVSIADKDVQITKIETVIEEELYEATLERKKAGELVAYGEEVATWISEGEFLEEE